MGEAQEQSMYLVKEADERNRLSNQARKLPQILIPEQKTKKWWARLIIYTLFVLLGQSSATLLSRLYYTKGGNTILLAALLETVGFPILIPFALYFSPIHLFNNVSSTKDQPSSLITSTIYIVFGLLQAASNVLYAIGLQNLPVSTFSLISTTQLGFNAFFSFFLNAQKMTLLILNSLILLTISSTLLIFRSNSEQSEENPERKQLALGFSCTLIASALYSLILSLTELTFNKILKKETFATVLNMIIYQSSVETLIVAAALLASGDWRDLGKEMWSFEQGTASYLVIVVLVAVAWQLCSIGAVGLIFEVSSLFSNVIGTLGLPLMPILAVIFFHEKMDGLKIVSIFLAGGGFASYVYQHYLDDGKTHVGVKSSHADHCISHEIVVL